MKRKVVRHGPSSLTVSLPAKWAKAHNIKAGDEISIEEMEEKLVIATELSLPKKEVTINMPPKEDYFQRTMIMPYVNGVDKMIVKYDDSEIYSKILQTSKLLMGFEIVENTEKSCTFINISTKLEQKFEVLLRRLFNSGITFTKELLNRLKQGIDCSGLQEYEDNANRLSLFCRRVINTGQVTGVKYPLTALYSIVGKLEESVDYLRHIVVSIGKIKLNRKALELFELCIKAQELNLKLFNRRMKKNNLDLFIEHKRIRKKTIHDDSYFRGDAYNSLVCARLLGVIELAHHISEELFE